MLEAGRYYTTICGYEVFIYSTDNGGDFPIHARVTRGDVKVATVYNDKGKTPSSDMDGSFDISIPKPDVGEVVLVGNDGDIFPTVAIFKGFDRDGFYGIVNDSSKKSGVSVKRFDVLISDVDGLQDAVDSFCGAPNKTICDLQKDTNNGEFVVLDIVNMSTDRVNSILGSSKEIRIVKKENKEELWAPTSP